MKTLFSVLAVLSVTAVAVAAPQTKPAAKTTAKPAAKQVAAKKAVKLGDKVDCAVMGEAFTVKADSLKSTYKGETYYFCCAGCKPAFDKEPTKYVKAAAAPAKKVAPKKAPAKNPA